MTNKEFWQLKVGEFVADEMRERLMEVVKRTVEDDIIGIVISKNTTQDIKNGRKYVQLTLEDMHGNTWYYDNTRKSNIEHLRKI